MTLSPYLAHALALALVLADAASRTLRMQWILRGLGHRITALESLAVNAFGEAGALLTPMRVGAQPARFAALVQSRVPARATVTAIAVEAVVLYGVVAVVGLGLAVLFAPEWWAAAGPGLLASLRGHARLFGLVAAATVACWLLVRRLRPRRATEGAGWMGEALAEARGMRAWPLVAAVPLSVINVLGRVLILPVLVMTVPGHPELGATAMISFALLYSQLVLPTPSGAGAVELGFLGGAAGDLGGAEGELLVLWRIYTVFLPAAVGLALALPMYGRAVLAKVFRGGAAPAPASGE